MFIVGCYNCQFNGQVSSISITGAAVPASFVDDISRHPLRFSFDDGRVLEICPHDQDPIWVLNFKRSILSTVQNAFHEAGENTHEVGFINKI